MKLCGIYLLTHTATGRKYVGQSTDIERRCEDHRWHIKKTRLSRAIQKYGWHAFTTEVIVLCAPEELGAREVAQIAAHGCISPRGFNLKPGGSQTQHNEETRLRISAAQRGRKHSQDRKDKISAALTGRVVSAEHRANISRAAKSRSPETIDKMRKAATGKTASPEARAKMAAANLGRQHAPETRDKISASLLGHSYSEETRAKLSAAARRRYASRLRNSATGRFL